MRRRAGRGEEGESGEKRKWRFFFAERRAEEDFIFALVSVEGSVVATIWSTEEPLDGDILGLMWLL